MCGVRFVAGLTLTGATWPPRVHRSRLCPHGLLGIRANLLLRGLHLRRGRKNAGSVTNSDPPRRRSTAPVVLRDGRQATVARVDVPESPRNTWLAGRPEKDSPVPRPVQSALTGRTVATPEVGGLHHRYDASPRSRARHGRPSPSASSHLRSTPPPDCAGRIRRVAVARTPHNGVGDAAVYDAADRGSSHESSPIGTAQLLLGGTAWFQRGTIDDHSATDKRLTICGRDRLSSGRDPIWATD